MRIKSNAILGLLAGALCAPLALAQGTMGGSQGQTQTPPPAQQGQMQGQGPGRMGPGRGQMGPQGRMNGQMRSGMSGQMNGRQNWHRHHMHGRMGYRGGNGFRGGARPMWGGGGMGMRRGPMGGGMMGGRGSMGGGRGMMAGRGMGRGGAAPLGRVLNNPDLQKQIGVTPEQVARIKKQQTDFQEAGIKSRANLQVKHIELNQLMSATTPDRAAIDAKLSEISSAQLASEKDRVHHQLDMKTALTADQQAKLKELMQSRQPGMGPGGRGGRGGPGAGRGGQPQPNKQPGSGDQPTTPAGATSPDGKTV
jgi:Spy/CpxP family protein refolding chaperone